jgi:addiction module HigA family antidote
MLLEEFLTPLGMSQVTLAEKMGVPVQRINTLINGKRGMTADTAILLSEVFGNSEQFWMNLQTNFDLWHAHQSRRAAG